MELSEGWINHPVFRKRVVMKTRKFSLPTLRNELFRVKSWQVGNRLFVNMRKDPTQYWSYWLLPKDGYHWRSTQDNLSNKFKNSLSFYSSFYSSLSIFPWRKLKSVHLFDFERAITQHAPWLIYSVPRHKSNLRISISRKGRPFAHFLNARKKDQLTIKRRQVNQWFTSGGSLINS